MWLAHELRPEDVLLLRHDDRASNEVNVYCMDSAASSKFHNKFSKANRSVARATAHAAARPSRRRSILVRASRSPTFPPPVDSDAKDGELLEREIERSQTDEERGSRTPWMGTRVAILALCWRSGSDESPDLRWSDVDWKHKLLRLRDAKTGARDVGAARMFASTICGTTSPRAGSARRSRPGC